MIKASPPLRFFIKTNLNQTRASITSNFLIPGSKSGFRILFLLRHHRTAVIYQNTPAIGSHALSLLDLKIHLIKSVFIERGFKFKDG